MAKCPYQVGKASDSGRRRTENEDRLDAYEPPDQELLRRKGSLYVVADGMGGHEAGGVASDRAVRKLVDEYYHGASVVGAREGLQHAVEAANAEVFRLSVQNPQWSGMGTTIVAAVVHGDALHVANVG
ncbi:MAG: serine/threonine-protein phosphatase, partial [Chloroflexi bacterium]|nr:serine/threonine-protein phosphatase [Chloroflexota bacterium]